MRSNFYLLLTFLFFNGAIFAQSTFQYSDIAFAVGDHIVMDSAQYVDVSALEGENMTWDLTQVVSLDQQVSFTVSDIDNQDGYEHFPNANLYIDVAGGGSSFGFFTEGTGTTINNYGAYIHYPFTQVTSITSFTDPPSYWAAPLTYGSGGSDTFEGTSSTVGVTSTLSGTIDWEVVGYGNLMTSAETHYDVLMVKSIENLTNELPGNINEESVITRYHFLKAGTHVPIMTFESSVSTVLGETYENTSALIFLEQSVGVDELVSALASAELYPNPTVEDLMLTVQLEQAMEINISVLDITGRVVNAAGMLQGVPGENNFRIDLEDDLSSGTYFVQLATQGQQQVIKFQKQ